MVHVHKFPLHRNSRAVCLVLIQHGADVHLQDMDGDTPLMLAEGTELKHAIMSEEKKKKKLGGGGMHYPGVNFRPCGKGHHTCRFYIIIIINTG